MKKLTAVVFGYGMRGQAYSEYALDNPEMLEVVAVADPVELKRNYAKGVHNLKDNMLFEDWREITKLPKMADFAIIATQDNMHYEPALACIEKGYHILLEKPMAPTARECKEIAEAANKKGVKVIVCHVLRFTPFYCMLKDIIDSGELGEIMSVDAMECVGNIHQSHSFVRGNWRNSKESSPMILAKSCHDTDILQWLIGKKCKKIQSFGSLSYFNLQHAPDDAPDYCVQGCPCADTCIYNAVKLYYDDKENSWLRGVVTNNWQNPTGLENDPAVLQAITNGPYGRCVFKCDNDVVDHQIVNMEFEGGCTVSFTMNAFNQGGRRISIFGTKGELNGSIDTGKASVYSFDTGETKEYDVTTIGNSITSGHGGGDTGIMVELMKYFNDEEVSKSICSIDTSYMNHMISFAAEESRVTNTVIDLEEFVESKSTPDFIPANASI